MSNRPEITMMLSISTEMYINPHGDPRIYWAKEVTFDYATSNAVRVDYMKFKPVNNTVSGIEKGDFRNLDDTCVCWENIEEKDRCNGCFGAANNDCHICPKNGLEV